MTTQNPLKRLAIIAAIALPVGVCAGLIVDKVDDAHRNTDAAFAAVITDAGLPDSAVPAAKDVALTLCATLDDGVPYRTALAEDLDYTRGSSVTPEMVGAIHGAGVAAYCPDHTGDIR